MEYDIDLSSSTMKIYQRENKNAQPKKLGEIKIPFQNFFSETTGITRKNYLALLVYIKQLVQHYQLSHQNCRVNASGIWRRIPKEQYENIKADFADVGLKFHMVTPEEELFYFQNALQEIYHEKKVLLLNIGIKTTEWMVYEKGNMIKKQNLQIGVAEMNNQFPEINDEEHSIQMEEVLQYAFEMLEGQRLPEQCEIGIYTTGEMSKQRMLQYQLMPNQILNEGMQEFQMTYEEFKHKNQEILAEKSLDNLTMLTNKKRQYLETIKASNILAQAIFEKANIPYVIPAEIQMIGK